MAGIIVFILSILFIVNYNLHSFVEVLFKLLLANVRWLEFGIRKMECKAIVINDLKL